MTSQFDPSTYIPRRLFRSDDRRQEQEEEISEDEFASKTGALVVLGEPGIGKSSLFENLSRINSNAVRIRAPLFVQVSEQWRKNNPNAIPLVDGLDEIAASQEMNPLDYMLAALGKIDNPDFILSCRAADWYSMTAEENISTDYGRKPEIWTLKSFTEADAIKFLTEITGDDVVASRIIDELHTIGLGNFYKNPLTLELIAKVAESDSLLRLHGRADLYEKACNVLLIDPQRKGSDLNTLLKDEVLDAAGAAMATSIITGQGEIADSNTDGVLNNLLSTSDIASLPNARKIHSARKSRLFRTNASTEVSSYLVPYHRTVAEFLAARWLSRILADDKVATARFLQMITVEGAVPTSLRGMFAWLAIYDQFSDVVINADPYGLIRYGDPARLPREKLLHLLDALKRLEQDDPYFRAMDGENISGGGLARIEIYPELRQLISDKNIGSHLKSLLLTMLRGTDVANQLRPELHDLIINDQHYGIRMEASRVLLDIPIDIEHWKGTIFELRQQRTVESSRIAINLLLKVGIDNFSIKTIADFILAECGFITNGPASNPHRIGSLWPLRDRVPVANISELLDLLVDGINLYDENKQEREDGRENRFEINSFGRRLIVSAKLTPFLTFRDVSLRD